MPSNQTKPSHIYLKYVYEEDLALNNLQWLICHETKLNKTMNLTELFEIEFFIFTKTYNS